MHNKEGVYTGEYPGELPAPTFSKIPSVPADTGVEKGSQFRLVSDSTEIPNDLPLEQDLVLDTLIQLHFQIDKIRMTTVNRKVFPSSQGHCHVPTSKSLTCHVMSLANELTVPFLTDLEFR